MNKKFWQSDRFAGIVLSIIFLAIAIPENFLFTGSNEISTTELSVPAWADIAEIVCLLLVACHLVVVLPRLKDLTAALYGYTLLAILILTGEILSATYSFYIEILMPCLLLLCGYIYIFSARLIAYKHGEKYRDGTSASTGRNTERTREQTPANGNEESSRKRNPGVQVPVQAVADKIPDDVTGETVKTLGRYTIIEEIGKGAMGVVYLGKDPRINRTVAIKTLPLSQEFDESEIDEVKARFFREAETAGRLTHPNIVTIYDVGEDNNLAYIAMEYLKGHDLKRFIRSKKLLPVKNVMQIIILAAEALNYAHQQNVIHRDIKPGNIMFIPDSSTIKLTDFGIARITDTSRTKTGIVLGTPSYMSPEQLQGKKNLDGRTDLFSLGVMFYQLLSGQLPFTGDSIATLMVRIAKEKHRDIRGYRPELVKKLPSLPQILDKILEKDPENRYQTGGEFAIDLRNCLKNINKS